jgi:hypothetical protein
VLALACRQRSAFPDARERRRCPRFASFFSSPKSISSAEMRVCATKGPWFAFVLCALASSAPACRRQPSRPEAEACATDGIVSSDTLTLPDAGEVVTEIVQTGCRDCARDARAGAAAGSACSAASVCAETCCACPGANPKTYYRARVCEARSCVSAELACATARLAIRPDVCASGTQSGPRNSSTAMP